VSEGLVSRALTVQVASPRTLQRLTGRSFRAHFSIDEITFVSAPPPPRLSSTFVGLVPRRRSPAPRHHPVGVQFFSGAPDGSAFPAPASAVFEIDTVTD